MCPVVFDYPMVREVVRPSCVVADIIDDQRAFPSSDAFRRRLNAAYEDVLEDADVVLANCEPVREGFRRLRSDIRVIPNGAEEFDLSESWPVPEELAHLPRPILGYVGNLRDRVDLDLIGKVADRFSHGSIVLIGSAHGQREVLQLDRRPNVHFLGVKPYDDAVRHIRAFDVALLPHLRNGLSETMNPLKLYVYFALGVPIVATDVANIGGVGPFVAIAPSHDAFIDLVERTLDGRTAPPTIERDRILSAVSWKTRVADALSAIGLDRPN